ncbi:MAG: hypothetical protein R2701_02950 [Acidimicrobiales bacterium]
MSAPLASTGPEIGSSRTDGQDHAEQGGGPAAKVADLTEKVQSSQA